MRLLDQVAQARSPIEVTDDSGPLRFPGAVEHAGAVTACPLRFVLDEKAAASCFALLESDRDMLVAENGFMRVPAASLWLEWPCAPCAGTGARAGLLVSADDTGRAGRIETFWEQIEGEPVPAQASVEFDLDGACFGRASDGQGFAVAPGLHPLAPHLLFKVEAHWLSYFRRHGDDATYESIRTVASNIMPGVEFLFAFSTLLSERSFFERREADLSRLNGRRAKRGKPALLDHIEVRLDLAGDARRGFGTVGGGREAARLHHVRGHMVRRNGAVFWRRSHLRGDAAKAVRSRTVDVTSGSPPRRMG